MHPRRRLLIPGQTIMDSEREEDQARFLKTRGSHRFRSSFYHHFSSSKGEHVWRKTENDTHMVPGLALLNGWSSI